MTGKLFSQLHQAQKTKLFITQKDTIYLDSLSLVPGSVNINDTAVKYKIDYKRNAIIFVKGTERPDGLIINYKTFPYNFERNYFHKDQNQITKDLTRPQD